MNKYDRMLAVNKQASEAKIEKARREIVRMVDDGEKVSIQKLMERTGLSRGFFYNNRRLNFHLAPMALFPKDFKVSAHDQIRLRGTSFLIHSLIHLRLHVVIRVHKPHIFPVRRLRSYITCYSGSFVFLMEYTKAGIFFRHSEEQLHAAVCRAIIYQNNLDIR